MHLRVHKLYKTGLKLYIAAWLSHHNQEDNKDTEIQGLSINPDIQEATTQDAQLHDLKAYIMHCWLKWKDDVVQHIQKYWPIRHELVMLDGVIIKGKRIMIILSQLQMQILSQLHSNHLEIEEARVLACIFAYWVNMNTNIKKAQ